MRLLFVVQGEGRGHLTQAISLWQQLQSTHHRVVACLVGKVNSDEFSSYLEGEIDCPVHYFASPNLIYNASGKGLSLNKTIKENLLKTPQFVKSLNKMQDWVSDYKPDLVINFYDFLCGLHQLTFRRSAPPMVCIGHQYLLLHPEFEFPDGQWFDRALININSFITSIRAKKLLALSFSPIENKKKIVSIPPLIRKEVLTGNTGMHNFYLAYLTNTGLLTELKTWHENHQNIEIHCFVKIEQEDEVKQIHKNLFVHKLNSSKFLRLMANAKGLITTAGFESVCEAIYFNKPVMMVPVPNHYEQACNAHDAAKFGAGIAQQNFNLDNFIEYIDSHESPTQTFKEWVETGKTRILAEIDQFDLELSI